MVISYNFNCSWNSQKQEHISHLLSERILLLTGNSIFEKIGVINFCEKELLEDKLSENSCLLSNNRIAVFNITVTSHSKKYDLLLEKDILLSMLSPGPGQSYFDNLILELKNAIQNN